MAWLTVYREAAGWLIPVQALCLIAYIWLVTARPIPSAPEAAVRGQCPWCDTRDCLDDRMCNCDGPCGSWLCVVKEESR